MELRSDGLELPARCPWDVLNVSDLYVHVAEALTHPPDTWRRFDTFRALYAFQISVSQRSLASNAAKWRRNPGPNRSQAHVAAKIDPAACCPNTGSRAKRSSARLSTGLSP